MLCVDLGVWGVNGPCLCVYIVFPSVKHFIYHLFVKVGDCCLREEERLREDLLKQKPCRCRWTKELQIKETATGL